ncbi:MAG TPA: hypothetical protein VKI45_01205 [Allosphingosinicella sp.]|nr:hypothetical protein [Allosphingosinicella sp.]
MKRVFVSAAIAGGLIASMGATAPATAQPGWNSNAFWRGAPGGQWERIGFLQQRIDRGIADGSLNRREGMRAQAELRRIRFDAQRLRQRGGGRFNPGEAAALQTRLDTLSRSLRWARHNGW